MYDPDKDPEVISSRKKWAAGQQEFKRKLDEALARMRKAVMAQNTQTIQTTSHKPDDAPEADTSIKDIEAPFEPAPRESGEASHLSADNIVQRVEGETGALVYDVIQDEKVLFSTLSAPLAHAFVQGYNAKAQRTAKPEKDKHSPGEDRGTKDDETEDGTVNPKEQHKTEKRSTSEKDGKGSGDNTEPTPNPPPAKKRETREADATPRKRSLL